tara:strand:+ start:82 stop:558 length:477 start_codon:yes stop_codon:yes gene_type:complete
MDNIGKNEALLRSSKDFQKLGEGKKRRRLLREAQIKDGRVTVLTANYFQREEERKKSIEKRLNSIEKVSFVRPEGMSDEEYTRKLVEMEAEKSGILPASPKLNIEPTGKVDPSFYTPRVNYPSYVNNQKKTPEVKRGPRGGRYTEDKTKEGRPYRRYF